MNEEWEFGPVEDPALYTLLRHKSTILIPTYLFSHWQVPVQPQKTVCFQRQSSKASNTDCISHFLAGSHTSGQIQAIAFQFFSSSLGTLLGVIKQNEWWHVTIVCGRENIWCSSCVDELQTSRMPGSKPNLKSQIHAQGQLKLLTNS